MESRYQNWIFARTVQQAHFSPLSSVNLKDKKPLNERSKGPRHCTGHFSDYYTYNGFLAELLKNICLNIFFLQHRSQIVIRWQLSVKGP